ncbi:MAG: hypothetical protein RL098_1208, partial [Bacteroidota bacterium]
MQTLFVDHKYFSGLHLDDPFFFEIFEQADERFGSSSYEIGEVFAAQVDGLVVKNIHK